MSAAIVLPAVAWVPDAVIPLDFPQQEAQPQYPVILNSPTRLNAFLVFFAFL